VQNLEPIKRGLSVGITSVIAITIVAFKKKKRRGAEGGTSTPPLTEGSVDLNPQSGGNVTRTISLRFEDEILLKRFCGNYNN
jgi:hypothetical protein